MRMRTREQGELDGHRLLLLQLSTHFARVWHGVSCSGNNVSLALVCVALLSTGRGHAESTTYYVHPEGDDRWSGRLARPNGQETDGPFASIERARDAIRDLKKHQERLKTPVTVIVRGGTYRIGGPLIFTAEDSGTEDCPITYKAHPGERAVISGGRKIANWEKGDGRIWRTEVQEVRDGSWYSNQLFVDGRRCVRARIPNADSYNFVVRAVKNDEHQSFHYQDGVLDGLGNIEDAIVIVFHTWESSTHHVSAIDADKDIVRLASRSPWKFTRNKRYYVENVAEGLDAPGEWYLDRKTGVLSYYPRDDEDMRSADVVAAAVDVTLVLFRGDPNKNAFVEYIRLEGLSFQHANAYLPEKMPLSWQAATPRKAAIMATGLRNSRIEACEIAHVGEHGIWLGKGCQNNRILRCHIHDLGAGGIRMGTQGHKRHSSADIRHNTIDNNVICDGGHLFHGAVGVWVGQMAFHNTLSHNEIFDFDYTGVSVGWRWDYGASLTHHNTVEYNHIHHVGHRVLGDMGGIYTLGVSPGTRVRNNLIHDVNSYAAHGIYPDEASSEILFENNIVYNIAGHCFSQHYGKNNLVRNNIFAFSGGSPINPGRPQEPLAVTFERNIVLCSRSALDYLGGKTYEFDSNLYWGTSEKAVAVLRKDLEKWQQKGRAPNSVVADPLFESAATYDFRLKPGSPAERIGFKPIDVGRIGLYGDPEWVRLAKEAKPRPDGPTVASTVPPDPILDDFEDTEPGQPPYGAQVYGASGGGSIRVTDETAASGKRSLKFVDSPKCPHGYDPHMFYLPGYRNAKLRFSCDLKNGEKMPQQHIRFEMRSNGPRFSFFSDGRFRAGKEAVQLPLGKWVHLEILLEAGAATPYTYSLTIPGEKPRTFTVPNSRATKIGWTGFICSGTKKGVFYVDNVRLEPVNYRPPTVAKPKPKPTPRPRRTPSPEEANEKRAGTLLSMARSALRSGQKAAARTFLEKILEDYPDTQAARKAKRLLEQK